MTSVSPVDPTRRRTPGRALLALGVAVAALLAVLAAPSQPAHAAGSTVRVTGSQGNWQLTVDGAPWQVKGVTYGPATADAGQYLPGLHSIGVNTVRTWGTDASTQPLLTAASANGIKVVMGFWLGQGNDYLNDANYKATTLNDIKNWVTTYRNDPGVLMWDVGNEVLLNLQNYYSGAQLESERNAYARYLNQVADAIHAIDPNHPVTSTDAWTGAWPYLKANAPDLDLYAVNAYGDSCGIKQAWTSGGYTKPYIVTESGPSGEWEVPNDANGVPNEPTDLQKRDGYTMAWNCIVGHTGVALGATLFNYGIENDFGGVWYNLLTGGERRLSYFSVARIYGGQVPANSPPVISAMSVANDASVPAGGALDVSVSASDPNSDAINYSFKYTSKYLDASTALTAASATQTGTGTFRLVAPQRLGVWKVYVYADDGHGNLGIETRSFRVVPPPVSGTNVAKGKPTTASSYQPTGNGAPFPANLATDGNLSTRWASDWSDPQWIQVDLGQSTAINHVQLAWEASYAKSYQIQISPDGNNWTTIYSTTTGDGGVDDLAITGTGRYIRMNGTQRGTGYGYSLYEFGVYSGGGSGGGSQGLDRTGWHASASPAGDSPQNMIDADPASRWTSGAPLANGQSITLDMTANHSVSGLTMDSGGYGGDYARGYAVYLSTDGTTWGSPVATGTGSASKVPVTFAAHTARYIKVVQTGSASSWWSLVDVAVFTPSS